MVSFRNNVLISFFLASLVFILTLTRNSRWEVVLGLTLATFIVSFVLIGLFVKERDPRVAIINDWTKASRKRVKNQVALTSDITKYRQAQKK